VANRCGVKMRRKGNGYGTNALRGHSTRVEDGRGGAPIRDRAATRSAGDGNERGKREASGLYIYSAPRF